MDKEYRQLYEKLVLENEKYLMQYIVRTLGCEVQTAKDIVQEVFVSAWVRISHLYKHENPVGWLYITANYIARREMNRAYRHSEQQQEDMDIVGDMGVDLPLEYSLPQGLKKLERDIILLRIEKQMSFDTIADLCGMKESACRKQYTRALERCRILLKKQLQKEERQKVNKL